MNIRSKIKALAVAAAAVLACSAGVAATWTTVAHATTSTCTNIANPVAAPIGCGGIYLPGMSASATQPDATSYTLTASSDTFNAPVVIDPYSLSNSLQDWTVFEVCTSVGGTRTIASPCGTGSLVHNPVDGNAEYVAMLTRDGTPNVTLNTAGNYCLSVTEVTRLAGGRHVHRWVTALRDCNLDGQTFYAGAPQSPLPNGGLPGVVTSVNRWQVWSATGSGSNGYVLAEDYLSVNFRNTLYVLDDAGFGGPGTQQLAFPENDGRNEIWKVIGCTAPVTTLTPGFYDCP